MNNSKNIIYAIVALATCAFAIEYLKPNELKETFAGMPGANMKVIRERVYENPKTQKGFYEVPGGFQSSLSPRAAGMVDYGAFIRYNQPDLKNLGVDPNRPLMAQNVLMTPNQSCSCPQNNIVEGYCTGCGTVAGCRKGGAGTGTAALPSHMKTSNLVESGYTPKSRQQAQDNLEYNSVQDMLPVQDMSNGQMVNALGQNVEQPIVYDRFIYANQKSRLYAQGDPIRGDLPIVPLQKGWFSPGNSQPQLALRDGALMAMGGTNNSTSHQLLALQNAATGGLESTGGGINYSVQKSAFNNSAQDLQVTAFP